MKERIISRFCTCEFQKLRKAKEKSYALLRLHTIGPKVFKNNCFKRVVRYAFLIVFLTGLIFFLVQAWTMRDSLTEQRLQPIGCNGWEYPTAAKTISLTDHAQYKDFHKIDSAQYLYRPSRDGVFGSDTIEASIECGGFFLPQTTANPEVTAATAILSFAGTADPKNTGVVVVESSYDDGQDWQVVDSFVLQGITDNATNDGYRTYPLRGVTAATLPHLRFRLRYINPEAYYDTTLLLDGLALDVKFATKQAVPGQGLFHFFSFEEQLVIIVDQKTLNSVEFLSPDGTPLNLPFVKEIVDGKTRITIQRGATIKPGVYIVRTKSKKLFRAVVQEQSFSFGVLNLNTPKSSYETGDLVPFAIGVLDDAGRTTCNASLTLTVTKPNGAVALFRTSDGSLAGSAECGPESLTNQPDYSAQLIADQPGTYTTHLEVQTDQGPQTMTNTFAVTEDPAMTIERLAPTRINPRTSYVTRLNVTPISDYRGTVVETVPADFAVSNAQPEAVTEVSNDRQLIHWDVDWKANQTYELAYTFDAPDVSPALFTVGPLQIGEFVEPRRWSMSSDKVIREEKAGTAYEVLTVTDADFVQDRKSLVEATKETFAADENAQIKAYKNGYTLPDDAVPEGLDPQKQVVVENVEVHNPMGTTDHLVHVSEEFRKEGRDLEILHLVPQQGFSPGVYTIQTTLSDGERKVTETDVFAWGVLVVNPEKSIYLPGEAAKLGMAVLDYTGKTLCEADLTLTITSLQGETTVLTTTDGSIARNYTCDVHSVTNRPDYSATYVPHEVGTYALSLTSVITKGQERTGYDQSYTIEDSFEVRNNVPFDVSRFDTPTRIYPVADYTANITVTANEHWSGPVVETVPASFDIYEVSDDGLVSAPSENGTKTITWQARWQEGETYSLSYRFDPPNPSPRVYPLGPLAIGTFHESRSWQLAADATRVWDGDAVGVQWSNAVNWDNNTALATGDTVVFDGSAGGTPTDASQWNSLSSVSSITSLIVSANPPSTLTFVKTPVTITGDLTLTSSGDITCSGSQSITVGGNYTNTTSGSFTPGTATVTMSGTSNTINTNKTHSNLTVNGAGAVITVNTNDLTVSSLLTIGGAGDGDNDTLVIGSGRTVTLSGASGTTLTINNSGTDEIDGPGRLTYQNSATTFPTVGTLAATLVTRFDTLNGDMTIPARTDYGVIEAYGGSANARTVTLGTAGSQTITASSSFYVIADAASPNHVTLQGATYDPTLNVGGTLDFTGTGAANEIVTAPDAAATWTVTGDVNLTDGTWTAGAETLLMDGTASLIANGQTVYNLTVNGSAQTVTVTTSDVIVSNVLQLGGASDSNNDTLTIASGRTVTMSGNSGTTLDIKNSGTDTINGPGRLTYQNSATTFPAVGTLAATLILRFNTLNGNMSIPARTDYGVIEAYNNSASVRTVTLGTAGSQTITTSSDVSVIADGTGGITLTGVTNGPSVTVGGSLDFTGTNPTGNETLRTGAGVWSVAGSVDFRDGNFVAATGNSFTMTGVGTSLWANSKGFYDLTFDPSSSGTITMNDGTSVANTLTIASGDTVNFNDAGAYIDGANSFVLSGTLSGPGTMFWYDGAGAGVFPATGTVSCPVFFYISGGDITIPARTFGGNVYIQEDSGSSYTAYFGSAGGQTLTFNGYVNVDAYSTGNITVDVATYDPTVNIAGDLDFVGTGDGTEIINAGAGTWTVSGSVDFTNGQYNIEAGNTLVMNGSGKTLTSASQTLGNLTLSGTITLANATHTVSGNLSMAGGTITPGTSTVSMTGTSNTIVGGGNTLASLTIDPASAGTITVQTSDLTVSSTLTVAAGDTLSIATSRTLSHTGSTLTWGDGTSTISGSGTLRFTDASGGPGTGGVLSAVTRFDASSANIADTTFDARTYSGEVDLYANSGTAKTVSCADAATYTLSGATAHLLLFAEGDGGLSLLCDTATDPTVTVGGNLDYQGAGGGSESITTGAGIWTVSGNVDFTSGTLTATTGNTFRMNGASTVLTSAGQSFKNFAVTGGAISNVDAMDVNGTFDVTSGEFTAAAAVNINVSGNFTLANGTTFTGPTGAGKMIFDGDLTLTDSNDTKQNLGNVQIGTSPDTTNLASDTKFLTLTVASGDVLYTNGYDLDVNGTITINGTFDATDDVETDETTV
ncbi:MAG: hypothetical protein V1778_02300, partial [bacterium]